MLVLLLTACDDGSADVALARADAFLAEHPRGTAIVQVPVGDDEAAVEAVVGTTWHGEDLAARLATCGAVPAFDASILVEAGVYPAKPFHTDDLAPCVKERLLAFPFEGPTRIGEQALVRVQWRPDETAPALALAGTAEGCVPNGLLELAPPYFRRAPDSDALVLGRDLRVEDSVVRVRPSEDDAIVAGPLPGAEAWARQLTCPAAALGLVRVVLAFEDGALTEITTTPEDECVDDRARDARAWFRQQTIDGVLLGDAGNVLVVLDVPVGSW